MHNPLEIVDRLRLIDLAKTLVSIPSVTGREQELSDWTFEYLKKSRTCRCAKAACRRFWEHYRRMD